MDATERKNYFMTAIVELNPAALDRLEDLITRLAARRAVLDDLSVTANPAADPLTDAARAALRARLRVWHGPAAG